MKNIQIFIIVIIIVLVLFYTHRMFENFVPGSYDITPLITVNMDWNGATLSKIPYYTNNLQQIPPQNLNNVKYLQEYKENIDGPTNSTYVANKMTIPTNLDDPNSPNQLDGFTMMNPHISD